MTVISNQGIKIYRDRESAPALLAVVGCPGDADRLAVPAGRAPTISALESLWHVARGGAVRGDTTTTYMTVLIHVGSFLQQSIKVALQVELSGDGPGCPRELSGTTDGDSMKFNRFAFCGCGGTGSTATGCSAIRKYSVGSIRLSHNETAHGTDCKRHGEKRNQDDEQGEGVASQVRIQGIALHRVRTGRPV